MGGGGGHRVGGNSLSSRSTVQLYLCEHTHTIEPHMPTVHTSGWSQVDPVGPATVPQGRTEWVHRAAAHLAHA